jgi:hypothetical protein
MRIDRWKIFLDLEGGGAWPFLVGGVICLVNSVNERDLLEMVGYTYTLYMPISFHPDTRWGAEGRWRQ